MADTDDGRSLRSHTAAIRHLDAARAREVVRLFRRPAAAGDGRPAAPGVDPVRAAADDCVSLEPLATDPADVVGHYTAHLYLHELRRLPLSVARELAAHRGHLYLDGVRTVTDAVAATLAAHRGGGLSLNRLRRLSAPAARALGRHAGELSLDRLRRLEPDVALGLAAHAHPLYLQGLARLSPQAAAALALHRGDLVLEKLEILSSRVARHLCRHRGNLHLHGVRVLSDAAAEACGGRTGMLCLNRLARLTPSQARRLAGHRGPLTLWSLPIDAEIASCLGRHSGSLFIAVADTIDAEHLGLLVQHDGPIAFKRLTQLEADQARAVAAQPCRHGAAGLTALGLDDVERISADVAAILATHRAGGLTLGKLSALTADVARELVAHQLLGLDGIKTVSDRVAGILATFTGWSLSLLGLEEASPAALAKLRSNPRIELPRRLAEPGDPAQAPAVGPGRDALVATIARIAAGERAPAT